MRFRELATESRLSVSVSLRAGEKSVALAREALASRIRVGTSPDAITGTLMIVERPSTDGTSLTFVIAPPSGSRGFVRIRID